MLNSTVLEALDSEINQMSNNLGSLKEARRLLSASVNGAKRFAAVGRGNGEADTHIFMPPVIPFKKGHRRKVTSKEKVAWKKLYRAGVTITEIGKQAKRHTSIIARHL